MRGIGGNQCPQGLLGFPLLAQAIDHRPVDLPVQPDFQAVGSAVTRSDRGRQDSSPTRASISRGTEFHVRRAA